MLSNFKISFILPRNIMFYRILAQLPNILLFYYQRWRHIQGFIINLMFAFASILIDCFCEYISFSLLKFQNLFKRRTYFRSKRQGSKEYHARKIYFKCFNQQIVQRHIQNSVKYLRWNFLRN